MTAFPGGAHDDLVDATVQALTYLREAQDPNILVWYRDLARLERSAAEKAHKYAPNISPGELARYQLDAGVCHRCGASLFMKSSVQDGPGALCMDCWHKAGN